MVKLHLKAEARILKPLNQFAMKKNMSTTDRTVRIVLAVIAIVLYSQGILTGTVGITLLVLAGVFVLTSLFNFCPIYTLLGIKRWERRQPEAKT
jgi:hypothetical protein